MLSWTVRPLVGSFARSLRAFDALIQADGLKVNRSYMASHKLFRGFMIDVPNGRRSKSYRAVLASDGISHPLSRLHIHMTIDGLRRLELQCH